MYPKPRIPSQMNKQKITKQKVQDLISKYEKSPVTQKIFEKFNNGKY